MPFTPSWTEVSPSDFLQAAEAGARIGEEERQREEQAQQALEGARLARSVGRGIGETPSQSAENALRLRALEDREGQNQFAEQQAQFKDDNPRVPASKTAANKPSPLNPFDAQQLKALSERSMEIDKGIQATGAQLASIDPQDPTSASKLDALRAQQRALAAQKRQTQAALDALSQKYQGGNPSAPPINGNGLPDLTGVPSPMGTSGFVGASPLTAPPSSSPAKLTYDPNTGSFVTNAPAAQ